MTVVLDDIEMGLEYPDFSNREPFLVPPIIMHLAEQMEVHWSFLGSAIEGPQAAAANGRLPASALTAIPGGRLEHAAAASWLAMRDYIGKRHGVWIAPGGPNSSYRLYAAQLYFWRLYQAGRGNVAAYPGTSNHGWGNAVDVGTTAMAYYIRAYGHLFGWSHDEGARVGEWWHMRYIGGYKPAPKPKPKPRYWYLTDRERRLALELEAERKTAHRHGGWEHVDASHLKRAIEIKSWFKAQDARILDEAKKTGWNHSNRKLRHQAISKLLAV
jgi:hypothetical protein